MRSTLPRQTTRLLPLTSEGPAKESVLKAKELCKEIVDISREKLMLHLHLASSPPFPSLPTPVPRGSSLHPHELSVHVAGFSRALAQESYCGRCQSQVGDAVPMRYEESEDSLSESETSFSDQESYHLGSSYPDRGDEQSERKEVARYLQPSGA